LIFHLTPQKAYIFPNKHGGVRGEARFPPIGAYILANLVEDKMSGIYMGAHMASYIMVDCKNSSDLSQSSNNYMVYPYNFAKIQ
jgi:hypothetical protein